MDVVNRKTQHVSPTPLSLHQPGTGAEGLGIATGADGSKGGGLKMAAESNWSHRAPLNRTGQYKNIEDSKRSNGDG